MEVLELESSHPFFRSVWWWPMGLIWPPRLGLGILKYIKVQTMGLFCQKHVWVWPLLKLRGTPIALTWVLWGLDM